MRRRLRSAQTLGLVLWSDEPGGVLEPAQEERRAGGKSVPIGPNAAEKATHELTHTSRPNWCGYCVRTRAADDHPTKSQSSRSSWRTTALCRMHLAVNALGMMAAISVEEKGPATYTVSAVVEHLRAWGRKKVIFRMDGEPAIRALGVAIQHSRSEETVIECEPKYSSPVRGVT